MKLAHVKHIVYNGTVCKYPNPLEKPFNVLWYEWARAIERDET